MEVIHQNQSFNIEFALANIKYNILGAPFFKRYFQNIDFQQTIMTYKEQHPNLPTKTHFSTFPQSLLEINKQEINDKTLQLLIPSVTGNLRPSDKIRKDFPLLP